MTRLAILVDYFQFDGGYYKKKIIVLGLVDLETRSISIRQG